jgi:hypothetical protein
LKIEIMELTGKAKEQFEKWGEKKSYLTKKTTA